MYGTIQYGQYGVCAGLVKAEGTSVLPTVPLASHNPINVGNDNNEEKMEVKEGREGGNGRIGRRVKDHLTA